MEPGYINDGGRRQFKMYSTTPRYGAGTGLCVSGAAFCRGCRQGLADKASIVGSIGCMSGLTVFGFVPP